MEDAQLQSVSQQEELPHYENLHEPVQQEDQVQTAVQYVDYKMGTLVVDSRRFEQRKSNKLHAQHQVGQGNHHFDRGVANEWGDAQQSWDHIHRHRLDTEDPLLWA